MTQFERIKNMSIDNLANFIDEIGACRLCKYKGTYNCYAEGYVGTLTCFNGIKEWLESDVEDNK